MIKICTVLVGLIILAGCSQRDPIEGAVLENLVDPDSAKFGELVLSEDEERACIGVNAKNPMGGYTGETYFIVHKVEGGWEVGGDTDSGDQDFCLQVIEY